MNTSLMETMSVIAKTNESLLERLNSLSTDHEKQKAQLQSLAKMVDQEEKGLVWTDILVSFVSELFLFEGCANSILIF